MLRETVRSGLVGLSAAGLLLATTGIAFAGAGKVELCHVPGGNSAKEHTINVSVNAVNAHLGHGDYLGLCAVPPVVDTDGDGLTDTDETQVYLTNPNNADSDADGLTDGEEVLNFHTNPLNADTDFGGVSDGEEVLVFGSNPLDGGDDVGSGT